MIGNAWVVLIVVTICLSSEMVHGYTTFQRMRSTLRLSLESNVDEKKFSPREERRRILKNENYNRMGFKEEKDKVEEMMSKEFTSSLVAELKANGGVVRRGDITVNERLKAMGIQFLAGKQGAKDFSGVKSGDVVILPAFGATIQEMQLLDKMGVIIVDTTCAWVSKVWNAVDNHRRAEQTSVIHGKYQHEETVATASFCENYIIVKDIEEAKYVADFIVNGGDAEEFMRKFRNAVSKGFDPNVHLKKVGLANQTTMYKRETKEIGRLLEMSMLKKYGPQDLSAHYKEFDTICDATQERQDAVSKLVEDPTVDFILVVGGFDSSNTAHLKEIPHKFGKKCFHIDRAERIFEDNSIEHRETDGSIVREKPFLRAGPITVGVTSGASTPDK
eukprot:scaffold735_cov159-Ochromonas_danica.AAC.2